jgi:hypothetical protein
MLNNLHKESLIIDTEEDENLITEEYNDNTKGSSMKSPSPSSILSKSDIFSKLK